MIAAANLYKASNWNTIEGVNTIKNYIACGAGVVIAIKVYPDFDNISSSNQIYDSSAGTSRGAHAICLIGYDDSKGAFKFINSWGTDWGLNGDAVVDSTDANLILQVASKSIDNFPIYE